MSEDVLVKPAAPPRKSPKKDAPDLVHVHETGHCFLQGDTNRVMDQHRGIRPYPPEIVAGWRDALASGARTVAVLGGEIAFLIAPDKQTVLWDLIGEGQPDHRNSQAIFGEPIPGLRVVDPAARLIEAARHQTVYPLTDSHWDMRGAYVAYRQLREELGNAQGAVMEEGHDFLFTETASHGDLGHKLAEYRESPSARVKRLKFRAKPCYQNGVRTNGAVHVHAKPGLTSIGMVFGDSFSAHFVPFLAEHYGCLVHIRTTHLDLDLVRRVRPDTVVWEVTERFMMRPPLLREDEPFELLFIHKLAHREAKREQLERVRMPLSHPALPSPIVAMVERNDALADLELAPGSEMTERQARYADDIFLDAAPADVLVAAYLAAKRGRPLAKGWKAALDRLHPETQEKLRVACAAR